MDCSYDRAAEDLGRTLALQQFNITPPDRQIATLF
jgi:hypothetical protein